MLTVGRMLVATMQAFPSMMAIVQLSFLLITDVVLHYGTLSLYARTECLPAVLFCCLNRVRSGSTTKK